MKYLNTSIIFLVLSCLNVINLWGQPPDLRSAEGFSVFTGIGAFNVTGPSSVTGDVGTNAGAFNGFPPGILSGQKYVENTVSQQASVDVGLLYDDLFGRTCDSVILVAMGNGQVLTPGVYCTGAPSKIAGSLIFDGLNDPTSIFIIQIDGTFSSTPNTMMTLINGASSCNVFWQINGMLTLAGNTRFKGNAVVQGAVSLLDSARVEGRILVTSGAINMASNVVTPCISALPIDLISFDAKLNTEKKYVSLDWQTASESNSSHFMIEKSADGLTFDDLSKISAKGNSHTISNYSFIDIEPFIGVSYYRLKQIDADGSFVYSNPGRIDFTPIHIECKVFPNPVCEVINIEVMTDLNSEGLIFEVYGSDGKMVKSVQLTNPFSTVTISDVRSGQYFYVLKNSETIFKKGTMFSFQK
jgi:hypothetical protein